MRTLLTATGKSIDILNPHPDVVDLHDIGTALSNQCRYGGHVKHFYSVAEHSVLLSYAVPEEHALAALLHDADEAYMPDLVPALKRSHNEEFNAAMLAWRLLSEAWGATVLTAAGLDPVLPDIVHEYDKRIVHDEWPVLCSGPRGEPGRLPLGITIRGWTPDRARHAFLYRAGELEARR